MTGRQYIFELIQTQYKKKSQVYGSSLPSYVDDIRNVSMASSSLLHEVTAVMRTAADKEKNYYERIHNAQASLIQEYTKAVANSYRSRYRNYSEALAAAEEDVGNYIKNNREEFMSTLENSPDKKIADMYNRVANLSLAVDVISAAQISMDQLYAVADVIKSKADQRKMDQNDVEEAKNILDSAYKIKDEGEQKLKDLDKEIKKLSESVMMEGFLGKVISKIKSFFDSAAGKLKELLKRAKKL